MANLGVAFVANWVALVGRVVGNGLDYCWMSSDISGEDIGTWDRLSSQGNQILCYNNMFCNLNDTILLLGKIPSIRTRLSKSVIPTMQPLDINTIV